MNSLATARPWDTWSGWMKPSLWSGVLLPPRPRSAPLKISIDYQRAVIVPLAAAQTITGRQPLIYEILALVDSDQTAIIVTTIENQLLGNQPTKNFGCLLAP